MTTLPPHIRLAHRLPGRARLVCHTLREDALDPAYIRALTESHEDVHAVRVNKKAGSLIVEFDEAQADAVLGHVSAIIDEPPRESYMPHGVSDDVPDYTVFGLRLALTLATPLLPMAARRVLTLVSIAPLVFEGVRTLLERGIKVEVLDGTVVSAAWLRGDYFAANAVATMLDGAHILEQRLQQRSDDLIKRLLRPEVQEVWVLRNGVEVSVPHDKLGEGELVVCGSGEVIPVDGTVHEGEATVNASSVTGESMPVEATPGDEVLSGSTVEEGRLVIAAHHVGSGTRLARIGRYLEQSLRYRTEAQSRSSELADRLVPVTFGLGLGMYLITRDIRRSASVLTVDYSCALKLTAPVSVKSSMYTASHCGVLLKGGPALEAMARADTVVFDKTGTLTTGDLSVTDVLVQPVDGVDDDAALLGLAAAAEEHYDHPVARAVVREATRRKVAWPDLSEVAFIVAHGVSAQVGSRKVLVGSRHYIADDEGVDCSGLDPAADRLRAQGKSVLYVALDGQLAGVIAMTDTVREEAEETLAQLRDSGVKRMVVLTGDHETTARNLHKRLPQLDEVYWDLKPEDKSRIIGELKDAGAKVCFVGDGVNDAPSLLAADVGVCMPSGADLARESAQAILISDNLQAIAAARHIAKRNHRTLEQCYVVTIGLNSLLIGLAAFGYTGPTTSALLHNAGSIATLGYAHWSGRKVPGSACSSELVEAQSV